VIDILVGPQRTAALFVRTMQHGKINRRTLVKDIGTELARGIDLNVYVVTSAENGVVYEYQKNTGKKNFSQTLESACSCNPARGAGMLTLTVL
jgi:hypothetical protein